jgi:predicted AlkP superfamily phosphohydrolase/phosphomutase
VTAASGRRVFLLGIDGVPEPVFERFLAEGRLPRFKRLVQRAARGTLVPTLPALTCPCWLSIASGAQPESLGISNLLLPRAGAAPDAVMNGFDRSLVNGEYLWDAMDRQGLPAIVLKYPGSWPPRPGRFLQVDGAGGYADITCRFDAARSAAYVSGRPRISEPDAPSVLFPSGYQTHWRTHAGPKEGIIEVMLRDPKGWRNLSADFGPEWEFVVPIERIHKRARHVLHGLAGTVEGCPTLILSPTKDARGAARLTLERPWTDWMDGGEEPRAPFRLKLISLDVPNRGLWLYRTAAHLSTGFTQPLELAGELSRQVGPVSEWTGAYDLLNGLVDFETQLEIYRQHTDWMAKAIRWLGEAHPWSGFFTHWHVVEYAHHLIGASLSTDHPLHPHETAARDVEWLARVYAMADDLLGAVESVIDDETLLVVASDHGHDLVHTAFFINQFLRRNGWLTTVVRDGREEIDWSRSVAYGLFPGLVRLNLSSRWPGGVLSAREGARVAQEITQGLRALRDERTGHHPVKLVLDRDDLATFGQSGDLAPDLLFCLDRGYETATRLYGGASGEKDFEVTTPYREVTSGHGSFFPGSPSARTMVLFAGTRIKPADLLRPIVPAVDVAPTMAAFLGIEAPVPCDGRSALRPVAALAEATL